MEDVVCIRFVGGPKFRYFRSTVCANAPNSIFDHHFNTESLFNVGKDKLPQEYVLDRDHHIFSKCIDPILRGYYVDDVNFKSIAVTQDLEFYNVKPHLPPGILPYREANFKVKKISEKMEKIICDYCKFDGVIFYLTMTLTGYMKNGVMSIIRDSKLDTCFDGPAYVSTKALQTLPENHFGEDNVLVHFGPDLLNLKDVLRYRLARLEGFPELGIHQDMIQVKDVEHGRTEISVDFKMHEPYGRVVMTKTPDKKNPSEIFVTIDYHLYPDAQTVITQKKDDDFVF